MKIVSLSFMRRVAYIFLVAACGSGSINPPSVDGGVVDTPLSLVDAYVPTADAYVPLADAPPGFQVNDAGQPLCANGSVVCQCSNGLDDDGDTFIDAADPECSGPFDNDESSYATGIPGDNQSAYVNDCFFDGNTGSGNDGCRWDIRCTDPPNGPHCNNQKLDGCAMCKALLPNGCDCFGCCSVYVSGVEHVVRIIQGCTAADINDPVKCPPCTKVVECMNPCEPCEYCIGRPPDPSCNPDAGGVCPVGVDPCPPPDFICTGDGYSCITGCCLKYIP